MIAGPDRYNARRMTRDTAPVFRTFLPSGLTVLVETLPYVRSVALGYYLRSGSAVESEEHGGASHFLEHLVFKGTENRTTAEIAHIIDILGGDVDAFTGKEYTSFYAHVLDEQLATALDLLTEIVTSPRFSVWEERKHDWVEILGEHLEKTPTAGRIEGEICPSEGGGAGTRRNLAAPRFKAFAHLTAYPVHISVGQFGTQARRFGAVSGVGDSPPQVLEVGERLRQERALNRFVHLRCSLWFPS